MSALVGSARRLAGRGSPVGRRLEVLGRVVEAGRGRLPDDLVERADVLLARASARLSMSGEHTVVALAGATGSGKSSMFNALTGLDLSTVGVRRPTTSQTTGCAFGADGAEIFDWLGVQRRHQVSAGTSGADGLVLLDLPDHDSTEVAHHLEVDRLVELVDVLVWVVDPQKYADAALHERYLRPLSTHQDVMVVVLNHIDRVDPADRPGMVEDLRRRLDEDGLPGVPVLTASALHGDGLPQLRELLLRKVKDKRAATARLDADITALARDLQAASGDSEAVDVGRGERDELLDALADAAGVPTVVRAVQKSVAARGKQQTGWLVTSWLAKVRPDPLRRLHLGSGAGTGELTAVGRASVPEATRVQDARVDSAVRRLADQVSTSLSPPWAEAVRRASLISRADLADALDRAVVGTDLGAARVPLWWRIARLLQILLLLALLAGALWLGVLVGLGYLQLPVPDPPDQYGLPVPTLLLVIGVAGGVALAILSRVVNGLVARSRARAAERRLRKAIGGVGDQLVVAPVRRELEAYAEVRNGLRELLRR